MLAGWGDLGGRKEDKGILGLEVVICHTVPPLLIISCAMHPVHVQDGIVPPTTIKSLSCDLRLFRGH